MTNKPRKPANAAKPSQPVHRVKLAEQAAPPTKASRTGRDETLRSVRRRRIRQAESSKVRSGRQRIAGQGSRGPARAARRSDDPGHGSRRREAADWPAACNRWGIDAPLKDDLYLDIVAENLVDRAVAAGPDPPAHDVPASWDEIAPGHLVIAKESQECGWWEATVVERNGDLVTLRYLDYPHCPALVRHRSAVALISLGAK